MASTLTAFDAVRARIASAILADSAQRRVGRFVLRDSQRRSVHDIRAALDAHGGALVADAAGSGKTVLALAVASAYDDVVVILPAALREQWARASVRAGRPIRIVTQESLSRGSAPRSAPLIIVDEAHHFRNPASARYRALATLVRGQHLLLLTATPVVNRRSERDALLALFLGTAPPAPRTLAQVVIRREDPSRRPGVRRIAALPTAADVPAIASALAQLPPPFPTADGATATALVRITLAFAWASSLAALDAALRRRLQRGGALADALRDGHWPTRDALRAWLVGPDATQLAFSFARDEAAQGPPAAALATLETHLDAVRALRALVTPRVPEDTAVRADALRALLARESPRRIVLLAHHADTIRALYAALRDLPGTVAIVGARVHAAAGRWQREEILRRVGPGAQPFRPDDIRDLRLLLATDILAEGVELQGCATLVHGDAAWTPARLEQRVGRVARDGQRAVVHVTHFDVPPAAERVLALQRRLRRKRGARAAALVAADAQASLRDALAAWRPPVRAAQVSALTHAPDDDGPRCAAAWAEQAGFVALLTQDADDSSPRLVAGRACDGRWRVSARAEHVEACVRGAGDAAPLMAPALKTVRALLRQWQRRELARDTLSTPPTLEPALVRNVTRRLDAWLADQSVSGRRAAALRCDALRRGLQRLRGVAAERLIAAALREPTDTTCLAALERLLTPTTAASAAPTWRLSALLLLRPRSPGDPAPPAASPGTAAIR